MVSLTHWCVGGGPGGCHHGSLLMVLKVELVMGGDRDSASGSYGGEMKAVSILGYNNGLSGSERLESGSKKIRSAPAQGRLGSPAHRLRAEPVATLPLALAWHRLTACQCQISTGLCRHTSGILDLLPCISM
jgi:hypothetical protein